MPTGEARRLSFTPGQARPRATPPAPGDYTFNLTDYGKVGDGGWKVKLGTKKFPNRMLRYEVLNCEDETTGKNKTVVDFITANPKAFFRVYDLALAAGYDKPFECDEPAGPTDMARIRPFCQAIDELLAFIKENGIALNGTISHEEYKGEMQGRITQWLAAGEQPVTTEEGTEEAEEEAANEDAEVEEEPIQIKKAAGAKKGKK